MKKYFPPYLSQMAFTDSKRHLKKITVLDYNLFIYLIYKTHKEYSDNDTTYIELEYSKISESINSKPNTDSIKESLEKIGSLQLVSNYLNSYENEQRIIFNQPFKIELIKADNGKSYGFGIKTSKRFLKIFDKPSPKVEVDYTIIYNLKNKISKLLYLFLRDALGVYEIKTRNVDIERLMNMMNTDSSNPNFLTQLKKSVKDINKNSNISVDYKVIKKKDLKKGICKNISLKFTIKKNDTKVIPNNSSTNNAIPSSGTKKVAVNNEFEEYLDELVEVEYKNRISNGLKIKTTEEKYKSGIRKNLLEKEQSLKVEFDLKQYLEQKKSFLREKITDNQPYMLSFTDGNAYHASYINNKYQLVTLFENKIITNSALETKEYIKENEHTPENESGTFNFDIAKSSYDSKYNVGRV